MAREEERRRQARKEAQRAIDEEALDRVLKAAGAQRVEPEARRALKAILEEAAAAYAVEAAEIARERQEEAVNAACIACAAVRAPQERREVA